ncbi:MAG: hypothetical protein RI533_07225, partial [Pontimonas sp.]|nr:hypothetical protein [Pontimonas sp.]
MSASNTDQANAVKGSPEGLIDWALTPRRNPGIQVLRAVAVVAVIVYHLNEGWLPGGFLGVDIFFVISGFVITLS